MEHIFFGICTLVICVDIVLGGYALFWLCMLIGWRNATTR